MQNNSSNKRSTSTDKLINLHSIVWWVLVVAWMGFAFLVSSTTGDQVNTGEGVLGQIYQSLLALQVQVVGSELNILSPFLHFMEYFVLGILLSYALRQHVSIKRAFIVAIVIASAYGILDEIHQYFVPGRDCDPLDWFIDLLGASFGALIAFFIQNR